MPATDDDMIQQLRHQIDALGDAVAQLSAAVQACNAELDVLRRRCGDVPGRPAAVAAPARRVALASMLGAAAGIALAARPAAARPADPAIAAAVDAGGSVTVSGTTRITSTTAIGVAGYSNSASGAGVYGEATNGLGQGTRGVHGVAASNQGIGVLGENLSSSTGAVAIVGRASGPEGVAVRAEQNHPTASSAAVQGFVRSSSHKTVGVYGWASAPDGRGTGVHGRADGPTGTGVRGSAVAETGQNTGVAGYAVSPQGTGVYGSNTATTGTTYGVLGSVASPTGFALYAQGALKVTGRSYLAAPASAPPSSMMSNGSISFWVDEGGSALKIAVKRGSGAPATVTLPLGK